MKFLHYLAVWMLLMAVLGLPACTDHPPEQAAGADGAHSPPNQLLIAVDSYDFQANPDLLDLLLKSPHCYFRFTNEPFTRLVRHRFAADLDRLPDVNLHGDAHVEQYAVTATSNGLSDFDAASYGPAVIDLVRFCTSLRLACRQRSWPEAEQGACASLLQNYLDALARPDREVAEPQAVTRIRDGFEPDRSVLIQKTENLMKPLRIPLERLLEGLRPYSRHILAENEDLGPGFFEVKAAGELKLGIGSRLQNKYLLRIEGPSADPDDDVFIEAREIQGLVFSELLSSARPPDPIGKILTIASRLCRQPDRLAGLCVLPTEKQDTDPCCFRIRTWEIPYEEISIEDNLNTAEDLVALAADVGIQLGRGHPLGLTDPDETVRRKELAAVVAELRNFILDVSLELTDLTEQAWALFHQDTQKEVLAHPGNEP